MTPRPDPDTTPLATPSLGLDALLLTNLLAAQDGTSIFFKDRHGRFIRVNAECARLAGRSPEEMIGLTDRDLTDEEHAAELLADEERILATGEPMLAKREFDRLADQPGTMVETSKFPLRDMSGAIIGTFGWTRDVTPWAVAGERMTRLAEESAEAHLDLVLVEAQLRDVLEGSSEAIAKHDRELRYEYINPAGLRLRRSTHERMIGRTDRELGMAGEALTTWEAALRRVLETGQPGAVEISVPSTQGAGELWFHTTLSANRDAHGTVVAVLSSTRDVTEAKRAEADLLRQATHDSLTGLANRALLTDRLDHALKRMKRHPGRLAVLFLDLDGFKAVNDQHGHAAGDQLLVEVARRLRQVTRDEDTVARFGGDEFVILCDPLPDGVRVEDIAARLVEAMTAPVTTDVGEVRLSASVGAATADDPRLTAAMVLRHADSAMYAAKARGRNGFTVFLDGSSVLAHP
ncbi:diguanylate cyclase domain-containing protein [Actinotalea sp.]|uniref:sensor domain-containing protein n=1 Tax=Actinotalea sp. TaxID=1872145 RepID=UPI0035695245